MLSGQNPVNIALQQQELLRSMQHPGNNRQDKEIPGRSASKRAKMRHSGVKGDSKGDVETLMLHTRVQDAFAEHLSTLLNDAIARDLQCCVTYGKPCGCIRKYIIAGVQWKEKAIPNLHIAQIKDRNEAVITANDRVSIGEPQLIRASELLTILHRAAELKKEKCYTVTTEGADGKPIKELRGMIGLGNGRKRSKKYEDFVLEKRGVLRSEYSLCEKAAQKLLGYSINFLYKKLRTNPQKTSRLVATNKAERASKIPRHLISLQQLQEMATNQQSASQCCCRNCISWLVKHNFSKIVEWRRRLEGSGQRVAQEIVAEVLLASASLDGQNSFCQNLVHWVTGCSFKKIRRVRDHLKKDPKTLPEHGLKKYWKDKVRNQSKGGDVNKGLLAKTEKEDYVNSGGNMDGFPLGYNARGSSRNLPETSSHISNFNNSNNTYDNPYGRSDTPNPPNQTVGSSNMMNIFQVMPAPYNGEASALYQQMHRHQEMQDANTHQMYLATNQQQQQRPNDSMHFSNITGNYRMDEGQYLENHSSEMDTRNVIPPTQQQHPSRSSVIIQTRQAQREHDPNYQEGQDRTAYSQHQQARPKEDPSKFYPAPFLNIQDSNAENSVPQPYYFTQNGSNPGQESFFPTGMTPLFLAQAQQPDMPQENQDGNAQSQFSGQSFFLLSPALPNAQDKSGNFTASDFENWRQMGMPLTPIQMYPASYFTQNEDAKNGQPWAGEQQHFMFPGNDANNNFNPGNDVNYNDAKRGQNYSSQQQYLQPALTPLVVQPQGGSMFSNVGWFAAPPVAQNMQQDQSVEQPKATSEGGLLVNEQGQSYYQPTKAQQMQCFQHWPQALPQEFVPTDAQQQQPQQWQVADSSKQHFVQSAVNLPIPETTKVQRPDLATVITNPDDQETQPDDQGSSDSSPRCAGIGERSKRFSRDRLRATIDSPCLPPMTPLTPALTPGNVDKSSSGKEGNSSASSTTSQQVDSSVFRFPPAHISKRVAALRMEGHINDQQRDEDGTVSPKELPKSEQESSGANKKEDGKETDTARGAVKPVSGTLNSASLSYIPDEYLNSGNPMLAEINAKSLPVLSLPSATWTEDPNTVTIKLSSPTDGEQQLRTPTQALNTPTGQTQASTQPLNTPTQHLLTPTLGTPTPQLNTPTQLLNTPTQDITSRSTAVEIDDTSPVKVLMPAPTGKKKKTESENTEIVDKANSSKLKFHNFTPVDFKNGEVNVSAFRKPSEFVTSAPTSDGASKSRRKPRKQANPQVTENVEPEETRKAAECIEAEKPRPTSKPHQTEVIKSPDKETTGMTPKPIMSKGSVPENMVLMPFPNLQTPSVLQRITPIFSLPPTSCGEGSSSSQPIVPPLNTPVFIPSAALNSAMLRRGSPSQSGSSARPSTSSTPQFFTFIQNQGFSTPTMFFTAPDFGDKSKTKQIKPAEGGKEKQSASLKRKVPSSLSLSHSVRDDALQTPSKINVVTPSLVGNSSSTPHVFSFQEQLIVSHGKTESNRAANEAKSPRNSPQKNPPKRRRTDSVKSSDTNEEDLSAPKTPVPTLVVDPPSDVEGEKSPPFSGSKNVQKLPSKEKLTESSFPKKDMGTARTTLHRMRSGGSTDLLLSIKSPENNDNNAVRSPLNTPCGIQINTPTMATMTSGASPGTVKLTSPIKRLPPNVRVHPQPLMVAPINMNPGSGAGGGSGQGVLQTPTLFHLISPSQAAPPSPSVLVYPFSPRGYARGTGSIPTASMNSPAFGLMQRNVTGPPTSCGSASLFKSALMKKWPVFQFPPAPPATSTENLQSSNSDESKAATESEDNVKKNNDPDEKNGDSSDTSVHVSKATHSSAAVSVICPPQPRMLDKLSGANDPCLSETAQEDP